MLLITNLKKIIVILMISLLITTGNLTTIAIQPVDNSDQSSNQKLNSSPRTYLTYWSLPEVISEPIFGQNNNPGSSEYPRIACEGEKLYVVWEDDSDINGAGTDFDIFYRHFDGNIWSEIQIISEPVPGANQNIGNSQNPDISVENGNVYIIWDDLTNLSNCGSDWDIFFRCNLTGSSWEDIQVISEPVMGKSFNNEGSWYPRISVEVNKIYASWADENNTNGAGAGVQDIHFRCNLTGSSWEEIEVISEPVAGKNFNIAESNDAIVEVDNGSTHIIWTDRNNTNNCNDDKDIFYRCKINGSSWGSIQVISEPEFGENLNSGWSSEPDFQVEDDNVYVVWHDETMFYGTVNDYDIFYRAKLSGENWGDFQIISEPVQGTNLHNGHALYPSIAIENSSLYVVWIDSTNFNNAGTDDDIFFRSNITGKNWGSIEIISEPIRGSNFNIAKSKNPNIDINLNRSYVVWLDENNTNGAGTDFDIHFSYSLFPPVINNSKVTPLYGNTSTYFNFTVIYSHKDNKAPTKINIDINGTNHSMIEIDPSDTYYLDGKNYYFNLEFTS